MSVSILDFWDPEDDDAPTMVLRYFYQDAEAQLAALELRRAGIPSFIIHSNSQTILPVGQGWIGLHIRRPDFKRAVLVLRAADMWEEQPTDLEEDYYFRYLVWVVLGVLAVSLIFLYGLALAK
ncbi:MAG: hypothetical protein D6772_09990 [Bacteroidetes bacterium]|nr:MAG: hypothetical protein D6772_09990 [Bacteroidota bacterium]